MDHWLAEVKKFSPHLKVCYYDSYSTKLREYKVSLISNSALKISDVDIYTVLDADIVVSLTVDGLLVAVNFYNHFIDLSIYEQLCTYTQLQRQHEAFVPNAEAETDHTKAEKYWPLFQHDWYRVITGEFESFPFSAFLFSRSLNE